MSDLQNTRRIVIVFGVAITIITASILIFPLINWTNQASALFTMRTNQTSTIGIGNMTFVGNMMPRKNMTMPGGNMTFGASLQNAKVHLTEAMMDLRIGDAKGAAKELNLTAQAISMHEKELKIMMMQVKDMMINLKVSGNSTSNNAT
jgi:hypothetical protein